MKKSRYCKSHCFKSKISFCDEPNSGLDPQTSLVIDRLIKEITLEYNITTVVNTHDMNSVMEVGSYVLYMYQGRKRMGRLKQSKLFSVRTSVSMNLFFASEFLKDAKEMRMLEETGKMPNDRNIDDMIK